MSTTDTNRTAINDLIAHITSGRLMDGFERYYADEVVMSENGTEDAARVGKEANRAYEQYFVDNSKWFGVRVDAVLADGNTTAYQMWMDFEMGGQRMARTQFAVQEWKDGKIVKETFHYGA